MPTSIGTGVSEGIGPRDAAIQAAIAARDQLGSEPVDVAVVFATGAHLADPEATLEGVHEALAPATLIGCGAGGVLAGEREVEDGTAVVVWAAHLGDGLATAFHSSVEPVDEGLAVSGLPDFSGADGIVLLPDPFSFPTDPLLREIAGLSPGVPVMGGLASGRTLDGTGALFCGEDVYENGAVGLRFDDVAVLPLVSQGAAPVGPEMTITAAEGSVIGELAGRPALEKLRDVVGELDLSERALLASGPLLGIVVDGDKPDYVQGDFLVRGIVDADPDAGSIAVETLVRTGQVVRLHARDATSADRDLRSALAVHNKALGGRPPAGSLVFSCNGRGRSMFGVPDHDAVTLAEGLVGAPAAGFFAAGEIGPVGPESYLHGFTATLAIFSG
ncbi:MAG TPA: FIST N-terminal domain-containing protein [Solirubrobacteraceae bacterium]